MQRGRAGLAGPGWGMQELSGGTFRKFQGAEERESEDWLGQSRRGGRDSGSPAAVATRWREPRLASGDAQSLRALGPTPCSATPFVVCGRWGCEKDGTYLGPESRFLIFGAKLFRGRLTGQGKI